MYSLKRESDNAGDSGGMSLALWPDGDEVMHERNARPRVGVAMRVGAVYARTYQEQDWWQTTIITEILEDREDYVRFRTENSVYVWTAG
jgi:hypothetical protein